MYNITATITDPTLCDDAWEFVQATSNFLSRTFTQVEGTDKFLKFTMGIGDLITYFHREDTYSQINSQFKTLTNMFGALNSVNRVKEWVLAEERAKFITSAKKTAVKVCLTVANFLESIKYLETLKLIELGLANSYKFVFPVLDKTVELSPLSIVKDAGVIIATVITLTDADLALAAGNEGTRQSGIDILKARKWELKNRVADAISNHGPAGAAPAIEALGQAGNINREEYIRLRRAIEARRHRGLPRTGQQISDKWNAFLNSNQALNHARNDGNALSNFWRTADKVHSKTWIKSILSIANDLGKIVIITTAIVGITILGLSGASAFMVSFLTLVAVAGTIGYVKFLLDDWYKQKTDKLNSIVIGNLNSQTIGVKY